MNEEASSVTIELAKELIELVRNMEPRWSKAYYRFRSEGVRYGSNGSYVVSSGAVLISAMKNAAFYARMNEKGAKLLSLFGKEKGVFLLIADANFDYDVKFEWEDLHRWEITKLNGGTGVPAGI
jgi:hypothetical protein